MKGVSISSIICLSRTGSGQKKKKESKPPMVSVLNASYCFLCFFFFRKYDLALFGPSSLRMAATVIQTFDCWLFGVSPQDLSHFLPPSTLWFSALNDVFSNSKEVRPQPFGKTSFAGRASSLWRCFSRCVLELSLINFENLIMITPNDDDDDDDNEPG